MNEHRYALLIASFEYDDPYFRRLHTPAQDVEAFSRVLRDPAMGAFCDVKILVNEPKDRLLLEIEDFFDNRNREDLLLLYFSGHGVKDEDGRLCYATKNTLHKRLVSTAIPAYQVNDLIGRCRSRRKILVLDCCYSGAFSKALLAKGDQRVGIMDEFKQGQGLVTLTASDAFQYSFEEEEARDVGTCSVFTRALVEGMETGKADKDNDQLISLDELYHYAYEQVRSETPQQTPHRSGEVEGDIIVSRNPLPPRRAELPGKVQEAIESPIPEVREGIVQTLDAFLRGRNIGLKLVVLDSLRKLTEDDSRKVASAAQKCLAAFDESRRLQEAEAWRLKEEQERPEREKAEAERQAIETAKAKRLAQEKAEQERLQAETVRTALEEQKKAEAEAARTTTEEQRKVGGEAIYAAQEEKRKAGRPAVIWWVLVIAALLIGFAIWMSSHQNVAPPPNVEEQREQAKVEAERRAEEERKQIDAEAARKAEEAAHSFSEEKKIRDVIAQYWRFIEEKDVDRAVNMYATERLPQISRDKIAKIAQDTEYYRVVDVKDVTITDNQATAKFILLHKKTYKKDEEQWDYSATLVKENGSWKILTLPGNRIK